MNKDLENKIDEILTRGVNEVIKKDHLKERLLSGEKLRIKFGIDPTSPYLHLGRAIALLKLKDLQELGHKIVIIIGDFTGVIGDSSDKESERPILEKKTVEKNLKTYKDQIGKILDVDKVKFHRNSEWLKDLNYEEISKQADIFSLAEFIARDNIKKRLKDDSRISLRELLYPLMQGYDSVAVEADLEIGGTDQRFNLLSGREMQRTYKQKPQDILMVNLIEGTDGRKMSSSWGNTVNLLDEPNEMLGKIMSMGDELIIKYFIHCARIPMDEIRKIEDGMKNEKINPRDAKIKLAEEIVKIYHGKEKARKAKEYFISTFSEKKIPDDVAEIKVAQDEIKLTEFLVLSKTANSLGEARRKIGQGGVEISGKKEMDWRRVLKRNDNGAIVKVGKKDFAKVVFLGIEL